MVTYKLVLSTLSLTDNRQICFFAALIFLPIQFNWTMVGPGWRTLVTLVAVRLIYVVPIECKSSCSTARQTLTRLGEREEVSQYWPVGPAMYISGGSSRNPWAKWIFVTPLNSISSNYEHTKLVWSSKLVRVGACPGMQSSTLHTKCESSQLWTH